jgi:hypothetical protein
VPPSGAGIPVLKWPIDIGQVRDLGSSYEFLHVPPPSIEKHGELVQESPIRGRHIDFI